MTQSASRMHFTVKSESTSQRMFLLTKPFMGRRLALHRNMAKLRPCSSAPPRVPRKKSSSFFIRPCGVTPIPRGVRVLPWTIARTSGARWNLYRESGCQCRPGPPPLGRDDDIVVAFFTPFRDFRGRHELFSLRSQVMTSPNSKQAFKKAPMTKLGGRMTLNIKKRC